MNSETSLWSFIIDAGPLVKTVLCILLCASIGSWAVIVQRVRLFKRCFSRMSQFEQTFWSGSDLNKLYQHLSQMQKTSGLSALFIAGFKEFRRFGDIEAARRAMRIVQSREMAGLEQHLPFLATVGSISPYVGLFGTVWGIMTSFRALGAVQQVSIAMVAPGISEALIATAIGLFAAIPAVIAYNRFSDQLDRYMQRMEVFQEELTNIFQRSLNTTPKEAYAATVQE